MSIEEYYRKNYLSALIYYGNRVLLKHRFTEHKKETIIITGNNLSITQ